MPNRMFYGVKFNNASVPEFKTVVEDTTEHEGTMGAVRKKRIEVFSRINRSSLWEMEYMRSYPMSYDNLDSKIKLIETIVRENYWNFRNKVFSTVRMFSFNGVLFKNPTIDYALKQLSGEIIETDLLQYLPLSRNHRFDIIDNKGGLVFIQENHAAVLWTAGGEGFRLYFNGELLVHGHPELIESGWIEERSHIGFRCGNAAIRDVIRQIKGIEPEEITDIVQLNSPMD